MFNIDLEEWAVPKELQEHRLSFCNSCEFLKFRFCSNCNCAVDLKVKIKNEDCPIEKWRKI